MAHTTLNIEYQLTLSPAEMRLVLGFLEGRAPKENEAELARELAARIRQQREAGAKQMVSSMATGGAR